jgi:UDP-N-acetyl-D-galactosamine dehydrogenase
MAINETISVVGLGYVGLPIAMAFGKKYSTVGYDINSTKVKNLKNGIDETKQFSKKDFKSASKLIFTESIHDIKKKDIYIVSVPTPITKKNKPDLKNIKEASKIVGKSIKKNSIIIFESTVYPGLTEEVCLPIIESVSNLKWKKDFFLGYSPERINPGDKIHKLENIIKVVSGDTTYSRNKINKLYKSIIKAGTYVAPSIQVAEAAKIIENTQRDINIALMNELSLICQKLNISTYEVLKAANTKWNFLNFKPGLVGGHCIGVDPYYLIYKAQKIKHRPYVINSGRYINDSMHIKIFQNIRKLINFDKKKIITFIGISFKEDCADLRNSKIIEIIKKLNKEKYKLQVYDPLIEQNTELLFDIKLSKFSNLKNTDILVVGPFHQLIKKKLNRNKIIKLLNPMGTLIDINWNFYSLKNEINKKFNYFSL